MFIFSRYNPDCKTKTNKKSGSFLCGNETFHQKKVPHGDGSVMMLNYGWKFWGRGQEPAPPVSGELVMWCWGDAPEVWELGLSWCRGLSWEWYGVGLIPAGTGKRLPWYPSSMHRAPAVPPARGRAGCWNHGLCGRWSDICNWEKNTLILPKY